MTMKFSKKLFIVVAVTFLSIVSSFLFMQSPSIAKASTEPTFTVTGAQIRESDPAGIRFVTNVPKTIYNDSLKFGTLLLPSKMLQENQTITLENYESLDALNIETKNWYIGPQDTDDAGNVYVYYSTIVGNFDAINNKYLGLSENYYDVDFTAISYYWDGVDTSTAVYTEVCERSLLQVASTLLADPSYNGNRTYLNQIVDACTSENTLSFAEGTESSYTGATSFNLTLQGNQGLPVVWASSNTNVATVENGAVKCIGIGEAVITATLGSRVASYTIAVTRPSISADEVNNFTYKTDVSEYAQGADPTVVSWVESYQGATGVMKVTGSGSWQYFRFEALQELQNYADNYYSKVNIKMYVPSETEIGSLWMGPSKSLSVTQKDAWVVYTFDMSYFIENWSQSGWDYKSIGLSKIQGDFYIDSVYASDIILPPTTPTGMEVVPIRNSSDMVGLNTYNSTLSYVDSYMGATGVIKAVLNGWGGFEFKPQQDASVYEEADYIFVRMYVESDKNPGTFWINNATTAKTSTVLGAWVDYKIPVGDVNLSAFNCVTADPGIAWTIYIDEIYAVKATDATGNEVVPIRNSLDTAGITDYGSTVTYVDEFQGATGLIKVDVASWGGFYFKAQQDASVFANYTYVVIKYWANVAHTSVWMDNATQAPFVYKNFDNVNTWSYFVMKTSELDLSSKILLTYNVTNGSLYIDEIFAANSLDFTNGGVVDEFTAESATSTFTNAISTEYLTSYEGKTGVVKVTVDTASNMNEYKFKSTNVTKEEIVFGDWDYFEITFYTSTGKWLFFNNTDLATKSGTGWYTLKVEKSKISNLSTFAANLTGNGIQLIMVYADSTPLTELYFDSIRFGKN